MRVCIIPAKYDVGPAQRIEVNCGVGVLDSKPTESPLDIHKRSYYGVGVSKR